MDNEIFGGGLITDLAYQFHTYAHMFDLLARIHPQFDASDHSLVLAWVVPVKA